MTPNRDFFKNRVNEKRYPDPINRENDIKNREKIKETIKITPEVDENDESIHNPSKPAPN